MATSTSSQAGSTLDAIVSALTKEFAPVRMYLFGSRATNTHHEDSDYDFVLVVNERDGDRIDNMLRAKEALRHLKVRADVFVYSLSEFNEWKDELSSIPETAVNTGREIPLG